MTESARVISLSAARSDAERAYSDSVTFSEVRNTTTGDWLDTWFTASEDDLVYETKSIQSVLDNATLVTPATVLLERIRNDKLDWKTFRAAEDVAWWPDSVPQGLAFLVDEWIKNCLVSRRAYVRRAYYTTEGVLNRSIMALFPIRTSLTVDFVALHFEHLNAPGLDK